MVSVLCRGFVEGRGYCIGYAGACQQCVTRFESHVSVLRSPSFRGRCGVAPTDSRSTSPASRTCAITRTVWLLVLAGIAWDLAARLLGRAIIRVALFGAVPSARRSLKAQSPAAMFPSSPARCLRHASRDARSRIGSLPSQFSAPSRTISYIFRPVSVSSQSSMKQPRVSRTST